MSAQVIAAGMLAIFTFGAVTALTCRWALANRADPADVDVTARIAPYTDQGGHVGLSASGCSCGTCTAIRAELRGA